MGSKYLFNEFDLSDYKTALMKASCYLDNMLNFYCRDKSFGWMKSCRVKSLKSINDKIEKKKNCKGKNFDYRLDLLDIAGLRVIFCNKNSIVPNVIAQYNGFYNYDPADVLNEKIHRMSAREFEYEFEKSKLYSENYDVSNLYGFVEFLMRNCDNVAIVKDYIMYQKPSGYQSLHVIISVPIQSFDGSTKNVPVEIQFRNYTQHLYNECEHDIRYKALGISTEDYSDAFNKAKRFLLSVANDAYIEIINECKVKKKEYFLIREN